MLDVGSLEVVTAEGDESLAGGGIGHGHRAVRTDLSQHLVDGRLDLSWSIGGIEDVGAVVVLKLKLVGAAEIRRHGQLLDFRIGEKSVGAGVAVLDGGDKGALRQNPHGRVGVGQGSLHQAKFMQPLSVDLLGEKAPEAGREKRVADRTQGKAASVVASYEVAIVLKDHLDPRVQDGQSAECGLDLGGRGRWG